MLSCVEDWEKQCGFRSDRGCVDQTFALRTVCEKDLRKTKVFFFMYGSRESV